MPAKREPLTCYPDDLTDQQWREIVRPYYVEQNQGINIKDSAILRELIREKSYDILNQQTRRLTMQRVYAEVLVLRRLLEKFLGIEEETDVRHDAAPPGAGAGDEPGASGIAGGRVDDSPAPTPRQPGDADSTGELPRLR